MSRDFRLGGGVRAWGVWGDWGLGFIELLKFLMCATPKLSSCLRELI